MVVFDVDRLASHTNADDETLYRDPDEIRRVAQTGDPIRNLERYLLTSGCSNQVLEDIRREVEVEVVAAEAAAYAGPEPTPIMTAKAPIQVELTHPSRERHGAAPGPGLTMRDAMRDVLRHQLHNDADVCLLGEDIEDPKGDVFGVTRGLSTEFPGRVRTAPLTEVDDSRQLHRAGAGRSAPGGFHPVRRLPAAGLQPAGLRTGQHLLANGRAVPAPVIVMVACGGYRPGLGPFHADTHEALAAHMPGIDVFMPSTAGDAAGLLNAAFESGRPTIFFYPKSLLNDPEQTTPSDVERQFVPIGTARKVRSGRDITLVAGATPSGCASGWPTRWTAWASKRNPRPALALAVGRTRRARVGRKDRALDRRARRQSDVRLGRRDPGHRGREDARAGGACGA